MLNWLFDVGDRLPRWSVPAVIGAIFIGGLTCLKLLFVLPALFTQPGRVAEALVAVCVAAAGGAAGGLVYSFVGRPLLRVPLVGPYLTGIVTVAGYLGSLAVMIPFIDPDSRDFFADPAGRTGLAFGALLFGVILGKIWFSESSDPGGELPHPEHPRTPRSERRRARASHGRVSR